MKPDSSKLGQFSSRMISRLALMLFFSLFVAFSAYGATPVSRKVLVLYDSDSGQSEKENLIYQDGQTILNYLGLIYDYLDVNDRPLPDEDKMAAYRGLICTFTAEIAENPDDYLRWLIAQMEAGRKVVFLGHPGVALQQQASMERRQLIRQLFKHFGFTCEGDISYAQPLLRWKKVDKRMVAFERRYPLLPAFWIRIQPDGPEAVSYLTVSRTDLNNAEGTVVGAGPAGGFAMEGFIYWEDPVTFRRQWYINPFVFFAKTLALSDLPIPDPTTLNGMRVAFSHVDGDAFTGFTNIDPERNCGEILRDEIFSRYDFPITVSVIVGEVDPSANGSAKAVELAREIYRMPNIEPASHSYSHPFYWDPDSEADASKYPTQYGIKIKGYSHDSAMEIDYSMEYITRELSPPEKPCRVFLWSGNCKPQESDIARCDKLGVYNMNGGDTVFDDVNDSYTSVGPYYRKVGSRYQIHTGQANENILTNLWTGPYYGFREITVTMENTERPRRIAPIDIYYHFYSGEYAASIEALKEVYSWVMKQAIAPVFTSDYIRMVQGYLSAEILQETPNRFIVQKYGECTTVRFDSERTPDLARCVNVLGFDRQLQGTYVSLLPGAEKVVIAFHPIAEKPSIGPVPYLKRATGRVTEFQTRDDRLEITYEGFGTGTLELAGLPPGAVIRKSGKSAAGDRKPVTVNDHGVAVISPVVKGNLILSWK